MNTSFYRSSGMIKSSRIIEQKRNFVSEKYWFGKDFLTHSPILPFMILKLNF